MTWEDYGDDKDQTYFMDEIHFLSRHSDRSEETQEKKMLLCSCFIGVSYTVTLVNLAGTDHICTLLGRSN